MSQVDAYFINYAVFFFCTWLGYQAGIKMYKLNNNKGLGWLLGITVWLGSMVPFAFIVPPMPN